MSLADCAIREPTMTKVQPVAQEGIEAKIGAKKMAIKNARPVNIAVRPVLPPSEIPAPDSMYAVTGEQPNREPMEIPRASTVYAMDEFSKSWVRSSIAPQKRAMEYRVPVQSRMST